MLVDKSKLIGVEGEFLPGVQAIPLPGHTNTSHGVAFALDGKRILVAGDAVVSRHHFKDNANNYEDDPEEAAKTQVMIKQEFDLVIPGHDNLIVL